MYVQSLICDKPELKSNLLQALMRCNRGRQPSFLSCHLYHSVYTGTIIVCVHVSIIMHRIMYMLFSVPHNSSVKNQEGVTKPPLGQPLSICTVLKIIPDSLHFLIYESHNASKFPSNMILFFSAQSLHLYLSAYCHAHIYQISNICHC